MDWREDVRGILQLTTVTVQHLKPEERWLSRYPDEQEKNRRRSALVRFGKFVHPMTVEGLLVDALKQTGRFGRPPEILEDAMIRWYTHLTDKELLAASSALQWYNVVRSFFKVNNVTLPGVPRSMTIAGSVYETTRLLSQDEVRGMFESCEKPEDKLIIAFLAQSGQREAILPSLKRDMITVVEDHGIVQVSPTHSDRMGAIVNKARVLYKFVYGPDTNELIQELPKNDGWVVDFDWHRVVETVERAASDTGIQRVIKRKNGQRKFEVHPHIFRRYWKNQMREGHATEDMAPDEARVFLDYLMGHRIPYGGTYDAGALQTKKILEAYKRADPKLKLTKRRNY